MDDIESDAADIPECKCSAAIAIISRCCRFINGIFFLSAAVCDEG